MRLTSLLLLAVVVCGVGYVVVFRMDDVKKIFKKGVETAEGYAPAKTPLEAMDFFRKAILARKYDTAANYVSGPFAEQFTRAHRAASDMGTVLDGIHSYANEKGIVNDKCRVLFYFLDPFPTNFKVKGNPQKSGDKTSGYFLLESIGGVQDVGHLAQRVDRDMFRNNLRPEAFNDPGGILLVNEGKDGEPNWKLKFPLSDVQTQAIRYYIDNHKAYHTGLDKFRRELSNDRYASKVDFEREFLDVVSKAK